jgi:quercetin dioxygenase-like cupin family protein
MPQASQDDVWIFIHDHGEVRTRDLEQAFVKSKKMSRGTLYNYKRSLESEGKIAVKPVYAKPPHTIYYVPNKYRDMLIALKQFKASTSKARYIRAKDIAWESSPPGLWWVPMQRKVLWHNEETGAMLVLHKGGPGLTEPVHYHPYANKWFYCLYGEWELPDGTRQSTEGLVLYVPKGEAHGTPKITKETMTLSFFDGPRTKVPVIANNEEQQAYKDWAQAYHKL